MALSDEQKRIRRSGITATDVAAIVGLSPHRSALDVFLNKVLGVESDETLPMAVGTALEPLLLREYEKRKAVTLLPGKTMRSAARPLVIATPDGIRPDGIPVEAKNSERWEDWGPDESDQVPEHYRVQSLWQQSVLDADEGHVIVMLSRYDIRTYVVPFDADYFGVLLDAAEKFHRDHIATETPPEPDGSEAWSSWLKQRFPQERAPLIQANEDCEQWAQNYLMADSALEAAEVAKRLARQQLELACGDAAGMRGTTWTLSWKGTKPIRKVDWEACARHLGATDDVAEGFTSEKPGYRPFRLTRVKPKSGATS
jgi:putative phage-type endonuclease